MFEVRCIVADKNVAAVIRLLDGYALEPPVAMPVPDTVAAKANGHAKEPTPVAKSWTTVPGGSIPLLRAFVRGRKTVPVKAMREHLEDKGYSSNGYSYAVQTLVKEGVLKKTKTFGLYEVHANG